MRLKSDGEFFSDGSKRFAREIFSVVSVIAGLECGRVFGVELIEQDTLIKRPEGDKHTIVGHHQSLKFTPRTYEIVVTEICFVLQYLGFQHGKNASEIFVGVGRLADGAHLSLFDQRVHRCRRFGEVVVGETVIVGRDERTVMKVININIIGLQISKRLFTLVSDVARVIRMRCGTLEVSDFGGDYLGFATNIQAAKSISKRTFRATVSVDIGVVPVIYARIKSGFDSGHHVIIVDSGPADRLSGRGVEIRTPHGPTPEADFGDFDSGCADESVAHIC